MEKLTAYQLERRADIFFAISLERIFETCKGVKIDFIIPEFPIRIGDIEAKPSNPNQSYKIDYLIYSKSEQRVFLVELKTDLRSARKQQVAYLENASKMGLENLVNGVTKIQKVTQQKEKYNYLLGKLQNMNWLNCQDDEFITTAPNLALEVIHILPSNDENETGVISFQMIIDALKDDESLFTQRFVESLKKMAVRSEC